MKVIVTFSGGKDSLATLILAIKKYGIQNIQVVFCDTKWEHPLTYTHIEYVMKHFKLPLTVVSSEKYNGFRDLVFKKKRFPSMKARFCTEELKSKPMIDWVLDEHKDHAIILQGIRKDESHSRSLMEKQCRFFKYYFEPYSSNEITIKRLETKDKLTAVQEKTLKKAKKRLEQGKNDAKYHTYRKQDVIKHCANYADDIDRPIFYKTAQETLQIILDEGLKPNPLYYIGVGRVGCFPCINVNHKEFYTIIQKEGWIIDDLRAFEKECGRTFFAPGYIPDRYCSMQTVNKKGENVCYPTIDDVVKYLMDKNAQGDLFEENDSDEDRSCMSFYGICE